ncbi:unnamed protein product [Rotaria sp. Silwood2]|nr:unnamed protein product [Rotaria sp. Silwood2]
MASILLGFSATSNELSITSADAPIFRKLTFIVVGFGLICMIIFHVGLKESNPTDQGKEYYTELTSESARTLKKMTWKSFLYEKEFYQCTLLWMSAKVIVAVIQVNKLLCHEIVQICIMFHPKEYNIDFKKLKLGYIY